MGRVSSGYRHCSNKKVVRRLWPRLRAFVAIIFGYHSLAAKEDPLAEAVELLALVCSGLGRCH